LKRLIAQERLVVTPHLGANTQEAQVNVAIDVSREILAYLDHTPLENAVNLPRFDPAVLEQMRPYFKLMAVLSEFGLQLMKGNLDRVTFGFSGAIAQQDCSPLTVSGLAALLDRTTDQPVNMVNAGLVAERMGLVVEERKTTQGGAFSNLVTLTLEGASGTRVVSGTLFEGRPRIVGLRDYAMDFMPEEHMLLLSYLDRPGMIGKIGTVLGQHDINIAHMNLGRRAKKGEAMVILSVDSPVPAAVIAELQQATEATFAQALYLPSA
jgi:D-3-phosphoglycerate dehydrogenase